MTSVYHSEILQLTDANSKKQTALQPDEFYHVATCFKRKHPAVSVFQGMHDCIDLGFVTHTGSLNMAKFTFSFSKPELKDTLDYEGCIELIAAFENVHCFQVNISLKLNDSIVKSAQLINQSPLLHV